GMLVDNAIVIVESTYRHLEEGKAPLDAARTAAAEVGWPVISSTLTTLCAFGPMLFWPGILGEFMGFLPLTLIVVLTSSLLVALVINPVLCATFMKGLSRAAPAAPGRLLRGYGNLLQVSLRWRGSVLVLATLLMAGLVALYGRFGNGVEFFPESDPNRAVVEIEAPQGTNLDTTDALARAVEAVLADEPDLKYRIAEVGVSEEGSSGVESRRARVSVEFVEREERREPSPVVIDRIRQRLSGIAGAAVTVGEEEMGPPTGAPVEVEIRGADVAVLGELVERAKARIQGVPGLVDLEDDLSRANPEIRVVVDRERATLLGLSTAEVSNTVKAAIAGYKVGTYREGEDEFDIVARLPETQRQGFADIERLLVPTQGGDPVPLSSVARLEMGTGFGSIRHLDQKRLARVTANTAARNANEVLAEVRERLAGLELPAGYSIAFAGESEDQAEAVAFLSKAFVIALFGIALILLTQFNSVAQAGIVLTSVLLSLTGVFFGLLVTGMPFGIIMTGIGVVSLAGVVVNNAIVLIDYINQLRREGLNLHDALVRAGVVRFRPVLLTAVTTILGMLPMALGMGFDFYTLSVQVGGESAQWWSPLAVAVIFGLSVATLLTLVVVPVLYSLSESVSLRSLVPSRRWCARGGWCFRRGGAGGQVQPSP
ncbi:MAG TPA: efflux RND transporter permease subunit, partial [Deferrisomatales bacterium]|nr:efflux RND transporter permease subunit [Deferrisomatales bacterium]